MTRSFAPPDVFSLPLSPTFWAAAFAAASCAAISSFMRAIAPASASRRLFARPRDEVEKVLFVPAKELAAGQSQAVAKDQMAHRKSAWPPPSPPPAAPPSLPSCARQPRRTLFGSLIGKSRCHCSYSYRQLATQRREVVRVVATARRPSASHRILFVPKCQLPPTGVGTFRTNVGSMSHEQNTMRGAGAVAAPLLARYPRNARRERLLGRELVRGSARCNFGAAAAQLASQAVAKNPKSQRRG
jgi:hypothetical protein